MTYRYSIFGLIIDSCLEFPELIPGDGVPDIHVRWGEVPVVLAESRKSTARFQAKPGCLLFTAEHVARLLISNGNQVLVEKLPDAEEAAVRAFVLGSALGAILHQRGLLPIHASGIKTGDGCVMFCGRPGTGKSTLAGMFLQRGYELHADDICVIRVDKEGTPWVYPAYPQLKLWGDALEKMGNEPSTYCPLQSLTEKFAVPALRFSWEPLTINRIFILAPREKDGIEIVPITGMNKYRALKYQTYRRRFLEGLGAAASHFHAASSVGKKVPLYRVHRPNNLFLLNELVDLLEKHISGGE
jgi:hypothetical protein